MMNRDGYRQHKKFPMLLFGAKSQTMATNSLNFLCNCKGSENYDQAPGPGQRAVVILRWGGGGDGSSSSNVVCTIYR